MKVQQLVCFKEIAETKNFTQAAKNLYIAQPGISYNINELESELGVSLLVRNFSNKNKVELTPYGEIFLEAVEKALEMMDDAKQMIEEMRGRSDRVVNVSVSSDLVSLIVYDVWDGFKNNPEYDTEHMEVNFDIKQNLKELEDGLLDGSIDFALYPEVPRGEFGCLPIHREKLYVYLPKSHPAASKDKISLCDLKDMVCIRPTDERKQLNAILDRLFEMEGIEPVFREAGTGNFNQRLLYVAVGMGYTIAAHFPVNTRDVAVLELDEPLHIMNVFLIWNKEREISAAAKCFMDYLKEYFNVIM